MELTTMLVRDSSSEPAEVGSVTPLPPVPGILLRDCWIVVSADPVAGDGRRRSEK